MRQDAGLVSVADAAARAARLDGFIWLGIDDPDDPEMDEVATYFPLHELALEDVRSPRQLAKMEDYGNHYFVVLHTARDDDKRELVDFGEINIFAGPGYAITVGHDDPSSGLAPARQRLESRPELLHEGPVSVIWAVLDGVVAGYEPVVEELTADIEDTEVRVFAAETDQTERIYVLKREMVELHRAVHPLLAPLAEIEQGENPRISSVMQNYFREINDHVKIADDEIGSQRELLTSIMEANLAVLGARQKDISVRQNESTEQLTAIATIFLPLGFITGFFGMNFGWLNARDSSLWAFLAYGIGSLAIACCGLLAWVRRRRYL